MPPTAPKAGATWSSSSTPYRSACLHRSGSKRSPRWRRELLPAVRLSHPEQCPICGGGGRGGLSLRFFAGNLKDVLCVRDSRIVSDDKYMRYGRIFAESGAAPPPAFCQGGRHGPYWFHWHPDTVSCPRLLARFTAAGSIIDQQKRCTA